MLRRIAIAFAAVVAALAGIGRLLLSRWEKIEWLKAPRPGKLIEVDGVRLHYIEEGGAQTGERLPGPPVVLIHGLGGHTYSFRHTVPALARHFRVIALDLKGFGYSERPKGGDYSLTEHARLVLRFMDALGIGRGSVLGHSMGGEVAMRVAAVAPERVERMVLAASVSGDRIWTLPPVPVLFQILVAIITRLFGRRLFKRMFYDPRHATEEAREAYAAPTRIRGHADALYELAKDTRRDRRIDYGKIGAPTLILWAAADRVLPRLTLRRLGQHFPRAQVVQIEKAGHLLLEERPDACNEAVLRFLTQDRVPTTSATEPATPSAQPSF